MTAQRSNRIRSSSFSFITGSFVKLLKSYNDVVNRMTKETRGDDIWARHYHQKPHLVVWEVRVHNECRYSSSNVRSRPIFSESLLDVRNRHDVIVSQQSRSLHCSQELQESHSFEESFALDNKRLFGRCRTRTWHDQTCRGSTSPVLGVQATSNYI